MKKRPGLAHFKSSHLLIKQRKSADYGNGSSKYICFKWAIKQLPHFTESDWKLFVIVMVL